jgi:hypothetical protein
MAELDLIYAGFMICPRCRRKDVPTYAEVISRDRSGGPKIEQYRRGVCNCGTPVEGDLIQQEA